MPVDPAVREANLHVSSLRAQVRRLEADKRSLQKQVYEYEAEEAARTRAGSLVFKPVEIPIEYHTAHSPGYPVATWSDWHWNETVRRAQTGGYNAYNRTIAKKRVAKVVSSTINLLKNYGGKDPEYPGLWLNLDGDFINGTIHEELRENTWGSTNEEAAVEVGEVLAGAMEPLADEFADGKDKFIDVPCIVGNHGRNSMRPKWKNKPRDNREYGIYKSLEAHFRNDERFRFHIPDAIDFHFSIYGQRFLVTHGDALGTWGGDGIIGPLGPIKRGSVKIGGQQRIYGRDFDWMIIGHWHTYQPAGFLFPIIVNGTLKGMDEFAHGAIRAGAAPPSQSLFLVSPKHGLGAQWAVTA